jgi:glycosyltransferase involved in cell wall biosynthesis
VTKILYATLGDPESKKCENNGFYLGRALKELFPSVELYAAPKPNLGEKAVFGPAKAIARGFRVDLKISVEPRIVKRISDAVIDRAKETDVDFIVSNGQVAVGAIGSRFPYMYFIDAPAVGLLEVGGYMDRWAKRSIHSMIELDKKAVLNAEAVFFYSEWAADLAVHHYKADPRNIYVIAPGANLDGVLATHANVRKEKTAQCELLFLGRDWNRKGGGLAYETLLELRKLEIPATLTVCGPVELPDELSSDKDVKFLGLVDKDDPAGYQLLTRTFSKTDYLILPTRSDISPGAIREACAFGVPSISTDVGGARGTIESGIEGILLPLSATASSYASAIAQNYRDQDARLGMRTAARFAYDERLNWNRAVRQAFTLVGPSFVGR